MQKGSMRWALKVMGLDESHTPEQVEDAYTVLENLWRPLAESTNDKAQKQGQEELEKIERARRILNGEEVAVESDGMSRTSLAGLIGAAFVVGFGGMYLYRVSTRRDANVVVPRSLLTAPKVRLDAPDINVSTERLTPVPLTDEEQKEIQENVSQLGENDPSSAMADLESMGERAIPALTAALSSKDDNVRMNATTLLNSIAAGPDGEPNTAEDMYKLRPIFRNAGTVYALEDLADDEVGVIRENVAYILGNIGDPKAYDTLVRMSTDQEPAVRAGVAFGLGKLNNPSGVTPLTALLEDSEPPVGMAAAAALASYKNVEARTALRDRLTDESDSDVIAIIQEALEEPRSNSGDGQGV
jgi:hypothetical protein